MDVEKIVDYACSRATVQFKNDVKEYSSKYPNGMDGTWVIPTGYCEAIEAAIPQMLKTALSIALTEILQQMEEKR